MNGSMSNRVFLAFGCWRRANISQIRGNVLHSFHLLSSNGRRFHRFEAIEAWNCFKRTSSRLLLAFVPAEIWNIRQGITGAQAQRSSRRVSKSSSFLQPKKKGRREEKVRKKKPLCVEPQCLQGGFWTRWDTGKKYLDQKIRRTAKDRLPEAVGGWLSQSLVSAPPPPPPSPLPHLCCDENGCPPQAQRHSRVLSGD